jgi:hypothetical protein
LLSQRWRWWGVAVVVVVQMGLSIASLYREVLLIG